MATTKGKDEAMNISKKSAHGLRDLFEMGLKDIYYAEKAMSVKIPNMIENASDPELKTRLRNQIKVAHEHVNRLEEIFKSTGIQAKAEKCEAMDGILKESEKMMNQTDSGMVRDASIIAADQKMKHYEIATYGTLHAFARTLGENKAASLLEQSLNEEKRADADLTGIAMNSINRNAFKADAITNIRNQQ